MIPLIAASCYEVFSRYVLGEPTLWAFEIGYMVMGTHFLIGLAYTLRERGHAWADKTKTGNPWFERVVKSQRDFETLWKDAPRYRNVKVKQA